MKKIVLLILGLLSALYGMIVLSAGSGTMFWTIWEVLGAFFVIWAVLLHKRWFDKHKRLKILFYGCVITGMIFLGVLCTFIVRDCKSVGEKNLDYIIVLGAQVYEHGPSAILKYRLDEALEYLNENPDTICIVTGAQGYNEPRCEGDVMAEYLIGHNIESNRIIIENKATDTIENMNYSKMLMKENYNGVGIVTNDFHVFRAVQLANAQELKNVYGIAGESHPVYLPNNILRECLAIVKEVLKRNIRPGF